MGEQVIMTHNTHVTTLFGDETMNVGNVLKKYTPTIDPIAITLALIDAGDTPEYPDSYLSAPARAHSYVMYPSFEQIDPYVTAVHLTEAAKIRRYYKFKMGTLLIKEGRLTDWQASIYGLLCEGCLTPLEEQEIGGIVKLAHFYNEDKLIERLGRDYPISMPNPLADKIQWTGKHRFKLIETMIVARKKGTTKKDYWFEVTGIDAKIHAARFRTPHSNPLNFFLDDAVKDGYLYVEAPVLRYVDYHPPRLELMTWALQQRK
tara:strand:+ start:537 stop:1319 length:783 start_codon:yes stop_codon:yes gene_type:complete